MEPTIAHVLPLRINQGELNRALKCCKPSISFEETRFNGVYMHKTDKGITFVATDGLRLTKVDIAGTFPDFPSVILPRQFVLDAIKATSKRNRMHFDCGMRITAKFIELAPSDTPIIEATPIDATFPDYQRCIPTGNKNIAMVRHDDMTSAVAPAVAFVSAGETKGRAVKLAFTDKTLTVSGAWISGARDGDAKGNAYVSCAAEGEARLEIGFNGKFLLDFLGTIDGANGIVRIAMSDAGSPAVFTSVGDDMMLFVIMPMRV